MLNHFKNFFNKHNVILLSGSSITQIIKLKKDIIKKRSKFNIIAFNECRNINILLGNYFYFDYWVIFAKETMKANEKYLSKFLKNKKTKYLITTTQALSLININKLKKKQIFKKIILIDNFVENASVKKKSVKHLSTVTGYMSTVMIFLLFMLNFKEKIGNIFLFGFDGVKNEKEKNFYYKFNNTESFKGYSSLEAKKILARNTVFFDKYWLSAKKLYVSNKNQDTLIFNCNKKSIHKVFPKISFFELKKKIDTCSNFFSTEKIGHDYNNINKFIDLNKKIEKYKREEKFAQFYKEKFNKFPSYYLIKIFCKITMNVDKVKLYKNLNYFIFLLNRISKRFYNFFSLQA